MVNRWSARLTCAWKFSSSSKKSCSSVLAQSLGRSRRMRPSTRRDVCWTAAEASVTLEHGSLQSGRPFGSLTSDRISSLTPGQADGAWIPSTETAQALQRLASRKGTR
jgi:hypothetical protein